MPDFKISASKGVYAEGKKVTLKATANKGYVFMGWYESGDLVSRLASHVLTMPGYDVSLGAYFISAEEDRVAIAAAVADEFWFDADNLTAEKTVSAGVYLEWSVATEALSATTVKVTGLPNGLKFTAKDIVDSKTKEVLVPANTIYGTPSAASKVDKSGNVTPSAVKITVTTAGKNSQTFRIDITVVALPERVVGTFTGGVTGETPGSASLTVAASGKISGKWISEGKTWTLAANDRNWVPESKSSLKFKARVYGWEPDESQSTADISFKYGHSAGTVCYPDVAQEPVESEPES